MCTSGRTVEDRWPSVGPVDGYRPPVYTPWSSAPQAHWSIATYGTDSFDVADVTVTYSFLTPEP